MMCRTDSAFARVRLCVLAVLMTIVTATIAATFPQTTTLAQSSHRSVALTVAWIMAQSFWLILPGLLVGLVAMRWSRRAANWIGSSWMLGVGALVLCDNVSMAWAAERFLSRTVFNALAQLPRGLAPHVAGSTWMYATGLIAGCIAVGWGVWCLSGAIATRMPSRTKPVRLTLALVVSAVVGSIAAALHPRTTRMDMFTGSARHPFCAVHLLPSESVGRYADNFQEPAKTSSMQSALRRMQQRQSKLHVVTKNPSPPDILIVVVESFRHELIAPDIMPGLAGLAERGLHCREHFSAGNATNHGIFSLVNGLDATWYPLLRRKKPILNRVFHEAGYETGFFAGHNDWAAFKMDGFISPKHFDRLQVSPPNGMESDRMAVTRAASFLNQPRDERPPRLAILYLYATHATYHSYADDRVFQPAASDGFLIPFSQQDALLVWNRYKNSARSVDRLLTTLIEQDRIVVVTGDHGEAFLEDGVCGHGTRVSRFQNMTPFIVTGPGITPRVIDQPTMHADLLPTLLGAAKIGVSDVDALDGSDLTLAASPALNRVVLTRNYLTDDCGLVQAGSTDFAHRISLSLQEWKAIALNGIDEKGNETETRQMAGSQLLTGWMKDRFDLPDDASF